jgi:acetylornithine deacetylase
MGGEKRMAGNGLQEKILKQVDKNFGAETEFLSHLVHIKSLVGQEGEGQKFYAEACRKLGMKIEMFTPEKDRIKTHPAYTPIDLEYAGRPNVIAEMGGAGGGRSLILNGHIDVVSPEPLSLWTVDPWGGQVKENRLYGRGAVDMKAGLAANLYALKALLDYGVKPKGKVVLESTIEEESGGSGGTLACFIHGVTADGLVISEPSAEKTWVTHPGIKYFRVTVFGRTAHAALSHTGVNAIVKMVPIIKALEALDLDRAKRLSYPLVEKQTGRPCNLSLGRMQAGDWISTVAGWATLECRVGFVPGETREQIVAEVENTIRSSVKDDSWFAERPLKVEWFGWDTDPWVEPLDSPLLKSFQETGKKVYGSAPELTGASGGLDARFGPYFKTPALSFGPAGANHHGIDEYVELPSLLRVTKTLALFIADWCGIKE